MTCKYLLERIFSLFNFLRFIILTCFIENFVNKIFNLIFQRKTYGRIINEYDKEIEDNKCIDGHMELELNLNTEFQENSESKLEVNSNLELKENTNLGYKKKYKLELKENPNLVLAINAYLGLNESSNLELEENYKIGDNEDYKMELKENSNSVLELNTNSELGLNSNSELLVNTNSVLELNTNSELGLNTNSELLVNTNSELLVNTNLELGVNSNSRSDAIPLWDSEEIDWNKYNRPFEDFIYYNNNKEIKNEIILPIDDKENFQIDNVNIRLIENYVDQLMKSSEAKNSLEIEYKYYIDLLDLQFLKYTDPFDYRFHDKRERIIKKLEIYKINKQNNISKTDEISDYDLINDYDLIDDFNK
jgi:hypothetical protein